MKKTVCELFAGVGGFRCGLNHIKKIEDTKKTEKWETVWFNQWEPSHKSVQWAHACYQNKFPSLKNSGDIIKLTNSDIASVNKEEIPDHNLLVAGFPCQDYSVASTLATSKGIEGTKGVLWWEIRETLEAKNPPFVLLENVDRLLKSPAKQRGRDFSIILACLRDLNYSAEWRVINAAEYGLGQRRRRVFLFAYKNNTEFSKSFLLKESLDYETLLLKNGFFATIFPVKQDKITIKESLLPESIGEISEHFSFLFDNSGFMSEGRIYSAKTIEEYSGKKITLGELLEENEVDKSFFIPENRLYYTSPTVTHSDETEKLLPPESRKTWQYIKGAKKLKRISKGFEYLYSEGSMPMIDEYDKPARTLLTSEGSFSRSTHLVRDKKNGKIRLLTPMETEHIQDFPSNWTKEALVNGTTKEVPTNIRKFMMGNALVVGVISRIEPLLSKIFENEK